MRSCPAWLILERRHEQDGTRAGLQSQDKVVRHAGRLGLAALVQVCLESAGLPPVSATAHGHRLELEFPSAAETNANRPLSPLVTVSGQLLGDNVDGKLLDISVHQVS
jgi:hypothetical protein